MSEELDRIKNLSVGTVGDVVKTKPKEEVTLTPEEIEELAQEMKFGRGSLNFTNLANKRAVAKRCKEMRIQTYSHTAHGSLLDPRYTVEGRHLPDRGLANDYKHFTPKLYCLENANRRGW